MKQGISPAVAIVIILIVVVLVAAIGYFTVFSKKSGGEKSPDDPDAKAMMQKSFESMAPGRAQPGGSTGGPPAGSK